MNTIATNRGGALMITLALMAMLSIVAIMAVNRSNTDMDMSYNQLHDEKAFYTAEAGIERALAEINNDRTWDSGFVSEQLGEGTYSVTVIGSSTIPSLADTIILRATATYDGADAEIEAWLVPERYRPFAFALFGDTSVSMRNAACTDSYNSDSGTYGATLDYEGASVGSNGTLTLENIAMIGGDAVSAIADGITLDNKSTVRGDTVTGVDPQEMDIVPDSEYVWAELNSDVSTGLSGGYTYDPVTYSLDIGVNETLVLSTGVYYFSDITLGQNAVVELEPGAEVTIYMTGDLVLGQSSEFNESGTPSQVEIYSTGSLLELGQSTLLSACFYGPEADFILRNYTNFYGSVVADYIAFEDNVCFHYDRVLSELEKWETGKMLVVAWREI